MVIGMENAGNRITYLPDGKYDFSYRVWIMGTRFHAYHWFYILFIPPCIPICLAAKTKTQTHPECVSGRRRTDHPPYQ